MFNMIDLELDPIAQDLLFREARTANSFTDEPVTIDQIRAIYDLVKFGPTALNMQPLRIVLIESDDARERLIKHMSEGNRDKTAAAPLVALLAADTNFHEHLPRVFPHAVGLKDNFGDVVGREKTARFNASLQIAYFLIGVRAAGLAAGPMGGFDAEGMDEDFFPNGDFKSQLVVNIGHPDDNAFRDRLPRLDFEDVVVAA